MIWRFKCSNILKQEQNEVQLAQQVGRAPNVLFSGANLAEGNSSFAQLMSSSVLHRFKQKLRQWLLLCKLLASSQSRSALGIRSQFLAGKATP